MNTLSRLLIVTCLALPFTACKKEEAPKVEAVAAVPLPTGSAQKDWLPYLQYKLTPHMAGISNSPFVYFLPAADTEDFDGQYKRQLEKLELDLSRGIIEGNMLVFVSPAAEKEVEMIETAFKNVEPGTMKGVKLVYIGTPILGERVRTVVEPAGVNYIFEEAK
ncbi:MAG: hypothetical protein KUL77_08240 [Thermomonas sp.]|jgi:hypothetical protein|uniref:hypothetical protein n=1 Tax=Thermomonas sp. TaxID=1971895 RepID=UPI001EB44BB6|nr:hypothetical protein [Thermomonas sp.]MBV2209537.1 hypothetical protein [Thermomonas sp.]